MPCHVRLLPLKGLPPTAQRGSGGSKGTDRGQVAPIGLTDHCDPPQQPCASLEVEMLRVNTFRIARDAERLLAALQFRIIPGGAPVES